MKKVIKNSYKNEIYQQAAEYKMKQLKSLLIKLPAVVWLTSSYMFFEVSPPIATWFFLIGLIGFQSIY
ncbi:MAG: hypothetical protein PHO08_02815 [Methylococcales bacterium]|nr:hypothetical protein [Methylococcales bacterium]